MKAKPIVCLIDEDTEVQRGWKQSLGKEADTLCYNNHLELFNDAANDSSLIRSFACTILGRYYRALNLDVVTSNVADLMKEQGAGPILLNWQGYITKEEVNSKFDGKLFHRYGVKWQTLRLRIQKYERSIQPRPVMVQDNIHSQDIGIETVPISKPTPIFENISRPERCIRILKMMLKNSSGQHKEKIEFYMRKDPKTGIKLLEAIYEKLLTDKNRPASCPSRYINSSPIIAKRILREALYK